MLLRFAFVFVLACSSEQSHDAERTSGDEVLSDAEPLPDGAVLAVLVSDPNAAEGRERRRQRELEEQRAAFRTECGVFVMASPPAPLPTPSRRALQTLQSIYEAALLPAPAPTSRSLDEYTQWARTTLVAWFGDTVVRLSALEQALASLSTDDDRAVGAAWFAHAHASLVASLEAVPIPAVIESDPELLRIYRGAFHDPLRPVLDKAVQALDAAPAPNPNWSHYHRRLREWLVEARCAFHPGRT